MARTEDPGPGEVLVQVDGSSRFNPGPAGIGVRVLADRGRTIRELSRSVGIRTNNQAEYEALLCGLEQAAAFPGQRVTVQTDSELLFRQVTGRYRVKNEQLRELHARAMKLLSGQPQTRLELVAREQNKAADRLARAATRT